MKDKKILIREANKSDCRDILKWRNDKISRKMSLDKNIILYKTHKAWFFSVLEDIYRTLYIGEVDNCKVGVCRFDFDKSQLASEISIHINPIFRGKGLGKLFLKLSIKKYLKNNKNDLVAQVRSDNFSSIKIFIYSDFQIIKKSDDKIYFKKNFEKK